MSDLIDAVLRFMNAPQGVTLYNVGVTGTTSVRKIADIICEELGLYNIEYEFTGGKGGWKGDIPKFIYNTEKIKNDGWTAKYSSDEAVRMTVMGLIEK